MPHNYPQIDPLDWSTIQPHVDQLLAAELAPTEVRAWMQDWSDLFALLNEAENQIYREITENTTDEEANARFKHYVQVIHPEQAKAEQALKEKLLSVDGYEPTTETALIFKRFQAEADLFREENISIQTELALLGKQYDEIAGGLSFDWEGESKPIPEVELLLSDRDRNTRERAWRLAQDAYLAKREDLDNLFLQMLPLRRQMAANAGFSDFRAYQWQVMARFGYTPEDAFTFHDAIEHEVVPLASEIYQTVAKQLGLGQLRPWETDLSGPSTVTVDPYETPLRPFENVSELENTTNRIFDQVDPVLGGYFEAMRGENLDLANRPNKSPGGYCEGFPVSEQPYIFMNAVGSADNVATLLHEGGHAFHFAESVRSQSLIWNQNAPMEFCEVASMSMELLSTPYWRQDKGGFYNETDFKRAFTEQLQGNVLFLPYMAIVDSFQHWLYVDAPDDIYAADLDHKWSELWDRFLPGIDYGGLQTQKETGWHRKLHIFHVPFYYIEYGLAQLGALQVWRNALQDQTKAVADYRHALSLGYTRPLPELFAAAGATFAFDRQTVGELMALVRGQLEAISA